MSTAPSGNIMSQLKPNRVLIPIAIGLSVTVYLFVTKYNLQEIGEMIAGADFLWVAMSVLVLMVRDLGYMYRLRVISDNSMSWKSCFYSIILWEFSSAITPGVVGGAAIASFILMKEGLPFGKALAFVMLTAILDNLFFVLFSGTGLLLMPNHIFPDIGLGDQIGASLPVFFIISSSLILVYTAVMIFGVFLRPRALKWLLMVVTSNKYLRRWRRAAYDQGQEIMTASRELKGKSLVFWSKTVGVTILIWLARYFMLNCLIAAFAPISAAEHSIILFRQVVMWVIMLISVTPGAAGLAELAFEGFFSDFIGNSTTAVGTFWRMFTYYPYLLLGALFLPRWFKRVFTSEELKAVRGENKKKGEQLNKKAS